MDNRCNELTPFFSAFDEEFFPGHHFCDLFPDHFSFHLCSSNVKNHIRNLDDITFKVFSNPSSFIVVSNAIIKNYVAMSIVYIHSYNKPVIKAIHSAVNVTTTEAELFTI